MPSEFAMQLAKKLSGMVSVDYHVWWANIIDSEIAAILPTPERVETYIKSLPWSDAATDIEKTLVIANIRTFAASLRVSAGMNDD
jgi:hypothetical protein